MDESVTSQRSKAPITRMLATLLVCACVVGCATYRNEGTRTPGEFTDDAAIQTIIKSKMLADGQVSGLAINVDVRKGVVAIYGPVPDEAARRRAVEIAEGVKGVTVVEDNLTVVQ
ncbi:MAG: BON domain-containing protein [Pseudomonadaceae bacterium]|nr:BON domain-containing protein [Pseudomonadaceae bacterium]